MKSDIPVSTLVDRVAAAWNSRDKSAILATYAMDARISLNGQDPVVGEQIPAWVEQRLEELGDFTTSKYCRGDGWPWVCVEYETVISTENGAERIRGAELYRIQEDGRIIEQRQYSYRVRQGVSVMDLDEDRERT